MTKQQQEPQNNRVLRFPEVKKRVPYSRMHIDRLEKAGQFPKRVQLGANAVGWLEREVDAWVEAKVSARDCGSQEDAGSVSRSPPGAGDRTAPRQRHGLSPGTLNAAPTAS